MRTGIFVMALLVSSGRLLSAHGPGCIRIQGAGVPGLVGGGRLPRPTVKTGHGLHGNHGSKT
jgi:hypothetical protein